MKKILYSLFTIMASVALVACQNDKLPIDNSLTGTVDLSTMNVTCDYDSEILRSSTDDFIITITEKSTNQKINSWSYSEMPEVCTLITGTYIIKAESCELQPSAWDKPYYVDQKEFKVEVDKVTAIGDLVCVLKNVKVTVEFSQDLLKIMGDDCNVKVELGKGKGDLGLDFKKGELQAGYFAVEEESNILVATFRGTIDGYYDTTVSTFEDVKAGEWRILRYSLKSNNQENEENGSFNTQLSVDASCTTVEKDVQVDVNEDVIEDPDPEPKPDNGGDEPGDNPGDEPQPADGPVISATTFDIKEAQVITTDLIIQIVINSEQPLAGLVVDIESNKLTPGELATIGLAEHLDLGNPGSMREALEGLGFPVAENVLGKNEVMFDITQFAGLLAALGSGTHNFILTATDEAGNETTETLTLIAE